MSQIWTACVDLHQSDNRPVHSTINNGAALLSGATIFCRCLALQPLFFSEFCCHGQLAVKKLKTQGPTCCSAACVVACKQAPKQLDKSQQTILTKQKLQNCFNFPSILSLLRSSFQFPVFHLTWCAHCCEWWFVVFPGRACSSDCFILQIWWREGHWFFALTKLRDSR